MPQMRRTNRTVSKIKHPISRQVMVKPTEIAETFAEYYKRFYEDLILEIVKHKISLKTSIYQNKR